MAKKTTGRGGLGRGLNALIPTSPGPKPTDVYFGATDPEVAPSTEPGAAPAPESAPADAPPTGNRAVGQVRGRTPGQETDATTADASDTGLVPVPGAELRELPIDQIHANAKQPRNVFDEESLAELTHSVREFGLLQPVVVRADAAGGYELVMGERRLRAASAAGLAEIPAIIRDTADDAMLRDALLENVHRVQLNPLEEAAAYQQLLEEFGVTHDELAGRLGRSRPQVSNTIRLLNLPVAVQRRVAAGVLSAGHARALLSLDDSDAQDDLAGRIVAEGLSVRVTEELVTLHRNGHTETAPRARSQGPRMTAPGVQELADRLADRFDTRVKVDLGRRKGRITVEFASLADLERIVDVMAPSLGSETGN